MGKGKETVKSPKVDKKKMKKEEKKKKKDMEKVQSLDKLGGTTPAGDEMYATVRDYPPITPKMRKKDKKSKVESPGKDSQCSTGKKKGGLFKRIGSFMLPSPALSPASPTAGERIVISQSCADLPGRSPHSGLSDVRSNSASSPNLFSSPPDGSPPPPPFGRAYVGPSAAGSPSEAPVSPSTAPYTSTPDPNRMKEEPATVYDIPRDISRVGPADYKDLVVMRSNSGNIKCKVENIPGDEGAGKGTGQGAGKGVEEVVVEEECFAPLGLSSGLRSTSTCSVEYAVPDKCRPGDVPVQHLSFSSDEEEEDSPRRSAIKTPRKNPSPRKDKRISFAGEQSELLEQRVCTPDILKKDLATELGIPSLPDLSSSYPDAIMDIPEPGDLDHLPTEERCEAQSKLLHTYQTEIHSIRDQVIEIVAEKSRLQKLVQEHGVQDIQTVQKQAEQVLHENRALIKEQQMNQARWQDLIEERNAEVLRIRAICSNMEEQNSTLLKRCNKLEEKNEELREAYNSIVSSATSADDFVPVQAHLSSVEGYKVALEELRKRYDDNLYEREEDIAGLEKNVQQLTEKVEVLEEEKALLLGQSKGLKESLDRAQHSSARHKREVAHLTKRVNTLKTSLAQAINIAEQSTLQKLELAEILQISDLQEKQKRSYFKTNSENKVKEVKKIANAKLKSCAEILQEREVEHEKSISVLQDKIMKLKLRNRDKNEANSDRTISN